MLVAERTQHGKWICVDINVSTWTKLICYVQNIVFKGLNPFEGTLGDNRTFSVDTLNKDILP